MPAARSQITEESMSPPQGAGITCQRCGQTNPGGALACLRCTEPLVDSASLPTVLQTPAVHASSFKIGDIIGGNRYEILGMLGRGGMGAVYKARDLELDRLVAIKIIKPELANSADILKRFKQELLLARQVTHKNVVRIFDLGEEHGTKFITMEYIEGVDLKTQILQRGKFSAPEAIAIITQVCHALDAAHAQGIIHRDLKPQNILVQKDGRVVVMDFGIAHSDEGEEMTPLTVAMIGTPDYMSPEQARAQKVDQRSDIFSLGLVFYELLTGKLPFKADTVIETIFKRTQESATPPAEVEYTVPAEANRVVIRCLETDPAKRYQSALEVLADVESINATRMVTPWSRLRYRASRIPISWRLTALALLVIALMGAYVLVTRPTPPPPRDHHPVQVLIADFKVAPGVLDAPLEPVLTLALEGASFVDVIDRRYAKTVAADLKKQPAPLDEGTARQVAVRDGIHLVISGSVTALRGERLRVSANLVEPATGKVVAVDRVDVKNKSEVLAAIGKLGASIRSSLGDSTAAEDLQRGAAETFTAGSTEAITSYATAQELRAAGKWEEAIQYYSHAVSLDPTLGRAYAGLAAANVNLGRRDEAEKYYQLAFSNIDRMTDREKYRTAGAYFLVIRDYDKAIEQFTELLKNFPADSAARNNLSLAYFYKRDMSAALVEERKFVELYPNNVTARNNVALYTMYAGDFATAKSEAAKALELTPNFAKGYLATALSELAQGRLEEAERSYDRMAAVSAYGASLTAAGMADLRIFEGRFSEAGVILEKAVAADLTNSYPALAADKLMTLASVQLSLGKQQAAVASAQRALTLSKDLSVIFRAAQIYIAVGQFAQARVYGEQLNSRLQKEPQAYAEIVEGEVLVALGKPREAVRKFEDARQLTDTWQARFDLGRAYLDAGAFPQASSEFENCLKRRGEVTAIFLDDLPTYHYFPSVFYYLGRSQEGMKSPGAAERYRTFIAMKEKSEADPLVTDARRRLSVLSQ